MTEYVKQLEEQNEELQKKLATSEKLLSSYKKIITFEFHIEKHKTNKKVTKISLKAFVDGDFIPVEVFSMKRAKYKNRWYFLRGGTIGNGGSLLTPNLTTTQDHIDFIVSFIDLEDIPYTIKE